MKLSTIRNTAYKGCDLIFSMSCSGIDLSRSALETVAEKVSDYLADPLSRFCLENTEDLAFSLSALLLVGSQTYSLPPLLTATLTVLATNLASHTRLSEEDLDELAQSEWERNNVNCELSSSETQVVMESEVDVIRQKHFALDEHLKVTSSLAQVNFIATSILNSLSCSSMGLVHSDVASMSLYGILAATSMTNFYHFLKRERTTRSI